MLGNHFEQRRIVDGTNDIEAQVAAFGASLRRQGLHVEEGEFGAHMAVSLINDGPFTIWLDSN